jgi:hypothetical protein
MKTHDQLVKRLMRRPGVRAEVRRLLDAYTERHSRPPASRSMRPRARVKMAHAGWRGKLNHGWKSS